MQIVPRTRGWFPSRASVWVVVALACIAGSATAADGPVPTLTATSLNSSTLALGQEFLMRVSYRGLPAKLEFLEGEGAVELLGLEGTQARFKVIKAGTTQVKVRALAEDGKALTPSSTTFTVDVYEPAELDRRLRDMGPASARLYTARVAAVLAGMTRVEAWRLNPDADALEPAKPPAGAPPPAKAPPAAQAAPAAATRPAAGPAVGAARPVAPVAAAAALAVRRTTTAKLYGFVQLARVTNVDPALAAQIVTALSAPGLLDRDGPEPLPPAAEERYRALFEKLNHEDYATRDGAQRELIAMGPAGLALAEEVAAETVEAELGLRLENVITAWRKQLKEVPARLVLRVYRNRSYADFLVDPVSRRLRVVSTARLGDGRDGTTLIDAADRLSAEGVKSIAALARQLFPEDEELKRY